MKKKMVFVFAALSMFFGSVFASQPVEAFSGGRLYNTTYSQGYVTITNAWPAIGGEYGTLYPGQDSANRTNFQDVDGFRVQSGCIGILGDNYAIQYPGGVWYKISDFVNSSITVYCN